MNSEKRTFERHSLRADVTFSHFNTKPSYFAQIMNLGPGGMCFNSGLFVKPGALICIYLKKIYSEASGKDFCEGLRSVTLAEVKWCSEFPVGDRAHYRVGVKYFAPAY